MKISIIVARDKNNIIGGDNKLLWRLPADLKMFKEKTMGHHIIMGRKTFESIGKPLPGRITVIISRNKNYTVDGCVVVNSVEDALTFSRESGETEALITGGGEIYNQGLKYVDTIYITEIDAIFNGDTKFDPDLSDWFKIKRESFLSDEKNEFNYHFDVYNRKLPVTDKK